MHGKRRHIAWNGVKARGKHKRSGSSLVGIRPWEFGRNLLLVVSEVERRNVC